MMNALFWLISFPHIICFIYYRRIIPEINEDLQSFAGDVSVSTFVLQLKKKEYRNVFYYRLPFVVRHLLNFILHRERTCYIHTKNIGGGLRVEHGFSSIIVAERIGKNFCFNQNVTVGWGKKGKPIIGDNVRIYTGTVVVGVINIGNNVTISANSLVTEYIPDNSFVIGNPCVILKKYMKYE